MEISPPVMHVLLLIIGVVIGTFLNYIFTRFLEERRHRRNLRTQAYLEFIRHFMDAYFMGEKEKTQSCLADATQRIAIYGSKEVIKAMADIKRVSAKRGTMSGSEFESKFGSEFRRSFVAMVQKMRKDYYYLPRESVSDEEISWLLFGAGLK